MIVLSWWWTLELPHFKKCVLKIEDKAVIEGLQNATTIPLENRSKVRR
jgi:hypothetical protein